MRASSTDSEEDKERRGATESNEKRPRREGTGSRSQSEEMGRRGSFDSKVSRQGQGQGQGDERKRRSRDCSSEAEEEGRSVRGGSLDSRGRRTLKSSGEESKTIRTKNNVDAMEGDSGSQREEGMGRRGSYNKDRNGGSRSGVDVGEGENRGKGRRPRADSSGSSDSQGERRRQSHEKGRKR